MAFFNSMRVSNLGLLLGNRDVTLWVGKKSTISRMLTSSSRLCLLETTTILCFCRVPFLSFLEACVTPNWIRSTYSFGFYQVSPTEKSVPLCSGVPKLWQAEIRVRCVALQGKSCISASRSKRWERSALIALTTPCEKLKPVPQSEVRHTTTDCSDSLAPSYSK